MLHFKTIGAFTQSESIAIVANSRNGISSLSQGHHLHSFLSYFTVSAGGGGVGLLGKVEL